jgi:RHS repeat-associated protein
MTWSDTNVNSYTYWMDTDAPTSVPATTTSRAYTIALVQGSHTFHLKAFDTAGNYAQTDYTFGIGIGTLSSPADQDRTQDSVSVAAQPADPIAYPYVQYQWAPGTTTTWTPASTLTIPSTGDPAPTNSAGTYALSPTLTWGAVADVGGDGLVQVRACFATSSTAAPTICTGPSSLQVARTVFGASSATQPFGPGTLSLLTGDLSISATDASVSTYAGALSVGRTASTLAPAAANTAASGVAGPGWTMSLPDPGSGRTDQTLTSFSSNATTGTTADQGYVILTGADRAEDVYGATSPRAVYPRTYAAEGDAADGTILTETTLGNFAVTDTDGTITTWTAVAFNTPTATTSVTQPGVTSPAVYTFGGTGLLTSVTQGPPGLTCTLTTVGCRSLKFLYGAPSSNDSSLALPSGMFDVAGRLAEIDAVVTDPTTGTVVTTPVTRYGYDANTTAGRLAGVWDPRLSALVARYTYVGTTNRLATLTPPGLNGFQLAYDATGRVTTVTQHDDALSADAVTTVAYQVPWSGGGATGVGLPDLSGIATGVWGQSSDVVAAATAVFGPDHNPGATITSTDWPYADVTYLDVNGRQVNTASYGAGAWQIETTGYDKTGNAISELTADNRTQALTPTAATDPAVAAMPSAVDRANALSTLSTYSLDGVDLTDTYGPMHPVTLADTSTVDARTHETNVYDEGAPTAGRPYHLVTTSKVGAQTTDLAAGDQDVHTTTTGYDPLATGDGDGWTLKQPTSVTTDPSGTNSTNWSRFDSEGRAIETRLPAGTATNGIGTDARSTVTKYYSVGGASPCTSTIYAGLVCQTGPAAPAGGTLPTLTTKTVTGYNQWQQPITVQEKDAAGTLLRTSTTTYDAAGRTVTSGGVTTTAVTGGGTTTSAVPTTTTAYATSTGLPTTVSDSAGTLTIGYDTHGRAVSSIDANGNATATSYDIAGRVATRTDGKATYTYTYDNGGGTGSAEHRGMLTTLDTGITATGYTTARTYTAVYDGDGRATTTTLPNGDVATNGWDNTGAETLLSYTGSGLGTGLTFTAGYDSAGRKSGLAGPLSTQGFTYTQIGELATASRNDGTTCTSQRFGYDANSNRTGYAASTTSCTAPATSVIHGYDAADRITDTGTVYDQLGRTITAPSSTVTGGADVGIQYFDNDMVQKQTQTVAGVTHTQTFTLDPSGHRIATQTDSIAGLSTNYYSDGSDSPAWTATPAGWTRNIDGMSGLGGIQTHTTATDTVALQLTDLSGNVVATVDDTSGAVVGAVYDYDPFGASVGTTPPPGKYGWLGGHQRAADDLGGLVLMGYRLYNPTTGRFLSTDPVPGGSANSYDYANQDPINQFDIEGTWSRSRHSAFSNGWHSAWGWASHHKLDIALTVASFLVPEVAGAIWAYRAYRAVRMVEEVEEASVAYRGMSLAARAGRNRVKITTPRGRYHFDLKGRAHPSPEGLVKTPHYKYQPRNSRSPHGWGASEKQVYPMTHQHMRWVERILG